MVLTISDYEEATRAPSQSYYKKRSRATGQFAQDLKCSYVRRRETPFQEIYSALMYLVSTHIFKFHANLVDKFLWHISYTKYIVSADNCIQPPCRTFATVFERLVAFTR